MPVLIGNLIDEYEEMLQYIDMRIFEEWMSDIEYSWAVILGSTVLALIISFVFVFILRFVAGCIIWAAIILFMLILFIAGAVSLAVSNYYGNMVEEMDAMEIAVEETSAYQSMRIFKAVAIGLWIGDFVYVVAICCLYHKIKFAIAIMKAAAHWLRDSPLVILVPPLIFLLTTVLFIFWLAGALYLWSSGERVKRDGMPFSEFIWDDNTRRMIYFYFFGGLWINAFLQAFNQFVLASCAAIWYFNQGPDHGSIHRAPILTSFWRAIRYHLGSLAFGSFILAVVQFIKYMMLYLQVLSFVLTWLESWIWFLFAGVEVD